MLFYISKFRYFQRGQDLLLNCSQKKICVEYMTIITIYVKKILHGVIYMKHNIKRKKILLKFQINKGILCCIWVAISMKGAHSHNSTIIKLSKTASKITSQDIILFLKKYTFSFTILTLLLVLLLLLSINIFHDFAFTSLSGQSLIAKLFFY